MTKHWLMAVATVLAALITVGSARAADPVTVTELRNVCTKLAACPGKNPDLDGFCGLVNVDPSKPAWENAKVPTVAQIRSATCGPAALALPAAASAMAMTPKGSASLDQSTVIWGATQFLLNRATAELQDWAIDRFVSLVCDDGEYAKLDGQPLFPNSCRGLKALSLDGFLGGLSSLQSAMKLDFAHLPVLLLNHLSMAGGLKPAEKDGVQLAMLMTKVVEANLTGKTGLASLPAALKIEPSPAISCSAAPATADAWELMSLIASFPVDTAKNVLLPQDDAGWRYSVMTFGINVGDPTTTWGHGWPADCRKSPGFSFEPAVLFAGTASVVASVATIETALAHLGQVPVGADPSIKLEIYVQIVAASLDPLAKIVTADTKLGAEMGPVGTAIKDAQKIASDLAAANYGNVTVDVLQTIVDFGGSEDWVHTVARLASFGADVAQATSADEVAAALNRAAAPVGSYKRKRLGNWYADLNAYVGLSVGAELGKGVDNQWSDGTWAFVPGFWVPAGFEFGHGQFLGKNSIGLLLQAVDLGALASWRVQTTSNDPLVAPPNVTFAQILSPGAAIVWGLESCPLSLALYSEWAPSLRQIGQTGTYRDALRVGASLAVDIPLFP